MKAQRQKNTPQGANVARLTPPARPLAEVQLPAHSQFLVWWELAAVTAAYIFVVFLLCPGAPVIAFPVHHDDFSNLSRSLNVWYNWRPVSSTIIQILSSIGAPAYYLTLHLLIVLYTFLSMDVLRGLLGVQDLPAILLFPIAAAMLSFENTVEYSKYTGLITNLLSGVFAMGAISLMILGSDIDSKKPTPRLRYMTVAAVWFLSALSFWSKEDFVLPVIVAAGYLAWRSLADGGNGAHSNRGAWVMLAGLIVEAALLFAYNRHVHNAFTETRIGVYKPDLTLLSILKTAWIYVTAKPGTKAASLLAASTLLWYVIGSGRIEKSRLLVFQAVCAALALPYLCLPNHVFPFYAFNWTGWQLGGGLLLLWVVWPDVKTRVLIAVIAAACLFITDTGRRSASEWYAARAEVNRNILRTLSQYNAQLQPYKIIAVEGAPFTGPWFGSSGEFVQNYLHTQHEWLVRVPKESDYFRAIVGLLGTTLQGHVRTVPMETEPLPPGVPLVSFLPDGSGSVSFPSH